MGNLFSPPYAGAIHGKSGFCLCLLLKRYYCHPRDNGDPGSYVQNWIPAPRCRSRTGFAGMTRNICSEVAGMTWSSPYVGCLEAVLRKEGQVADVTDRTDQLHQISLLDLGEAFLSPPSADPSRETTLLVPFFPLRSSLGVADFVV